MGERLGHRWHTRSATPPPQGPPAVLRAVFRAQNARRRSDAKASLRRRPIAYPA